MVPRPEIQWEQRTKGLNQSRYFPVEGVKGVNLEFKQPEGLFKNVKVRFFVGGPEHRGNNPITNECVKLIKSANKSIMFGNSQFNPDKKILKALKQKKIKVTGIFNKNVQKLFLVYPSRVNYKYLNKIYEYDRGPTLYHKKILVIDNKKAMIGSYNFSQKSAHYDNEIALEIEDEQFTGVLKNALNEDIKNSKEYKYSREDVLSKIKALVGSLLGELVYNFT